MNIGKYFYQLLDLWTTTTSSQLNLENGAAGAKKNCKALQALR
jgi:hypothetical protein